MKKLTIIALAILGMAFAGYAQTKDEYEQKGNTFKKVESEKTIKKGAEPMLTPFFYEDSKGEKYPIYLSNGGKGASYILRTSKKTGKVYKCYLGKEVTEKVKKELNIEE